MVCPMLSRIDEPQLNLKDIWAGDIFKRKAFADTICSLLKSNSQSSVLGINAPYGFGKTFFLVRLREQIKNELGWVIYVNSWEYDYLESPLFALLDALKLAANETAGEKASRAALKDIARAAVPAISKAAGKKILEVVAGSEGSKDVIEAVSEAAGGASKNLVDRFLKEDSTHNALASLREAISHFVQKNIRDQSDYKSLVIIVDELDRAKPSFSIRFLETIKHLFNLSSVTFVIGCDRSALLSSARHEYGDKLDADGYLRRLFDYWIDLPAPNATRYAEYCAGKLNLLSDGVLTASENIADGMKLYNDCLLLGRSPAEVSLRYIEQSVAHAGVILRISGTDKHAALIGWLQNLKQCAPDLCRLYISNVPISQIYPHLQDYPSFRDASVFLKALIFLWASNAKEPPTDERLSQLLGHPNPVKEMILRVRSDWHMDCTERISMAANVDKRMCTVTLSY